MSWKFLILGGLILAFERDLSVASVLDSLEFATDCSLDEGPSKDPVIALSPLRLVEVVILLNFKQKVRRCGHVKSKTRIRTVVETSTDFCVLGTCINGMCRCLPGFSGPKCTSYSGDCWLFYCYLSGCRPGLQRLHCRCETAQSVNRVTSGQYWYDEGLSTVYIPRPQVHYPQVHYPQVHYPQVHYPQVYYPERNQDLNSVHQTYSTDASGSFDVSQKEQFNNHKVVNNFNFTIVDKQTIPFLNEDVNSNNNNLINHEKVDESNRNLNPLLVGQITNVPEDKGLIKVPKTGGNNGVDEESDDSETETEVKTTMQPSSNSSPKLHFSLMVKSFTFALLAHWIVTV